MNGSQAVAEELERSGVEAIFGLLGEDIAPLAIACRGSGIAYFGARHENQAVAMADGYARATGEVAVAMVTDGPGLTNALTAINTASRHGSQVVVIVGKGIGGAKAISHAAVLGAIGVTLRSPSGPREMVGELRQAVHDARNHAARVLTLPSAFLDEDLLPDIGTALIPIERHPARPSPGTIDDVADLLQIPWMASRPVILAGRGAVLADAGAALRRLADRIGALLCTTLRAPYLFRGEAFDLGFAGTYATPIASELLSNADVLLAFGASLNKFTTYDGALFQKAKIVQVDAAVDAIGVHSDVDDELAVVADARLTAEAIDTELSVRGHTAQGYRTAAIASRISEFDPVTTFTDVSRSGTIDPRALALRLDRELPEDRIVVIDGGHNSAFWVPYLRAPDSASFLQTSYVGGAGSIGLSTGAGIGAAVGRRDRLVVVCVGDAGHLMALGDIETAVRYELPVLFLVSNDRALGAEAHYLTLRGLPDEIAKVRTPDFAKVAESLGAEGCTVSSHADLDRLVERLRQPLTGPLVVDCLVDPAVRAEGLELLWGGRVASKA